MHSIGSSISKLELRSGKVKVSHDRSRLICISSEADWRAKSFGTICASLSSSCHELFAKTWFWPHLTSGDPPWPQSISCILMITDGATGHDAEIIGSFRLVYAKREAFSHFPIGQFHGNVINIANLWKCSNPNENYITSYVNNKILENRL